MIHGLGTDIVEMTRIDGALSHYGQKFANRILSENELNEFCTFSKSRQVEFLAGRFAAKEAIAKALGCGLANLHMQEVELHVGNRGLQVSTGNLIHRLIGQDDKIHVSISHTSSVAYAVAIWEIACQGCT